MKPVVLLSLTAGLPLACANIVPTADTLRACTALHDKYLSKLAFDPLGPSGIKSIANANVYNDAQTQYWSLANLSLRPACAFTPSNADEVSAAIQILNRLPSVEFALKGGGHNPNPGFSGTDKGILIAFRPNMMTAVPSADGQTIDVGPGCKWADVYRALKPLKKVAVGGRLGDVGVMGLTLGGGYSHLSLHRGFACDNVVSYDVVLANGTIATANATSHPDLFFALCGGGNEFAVVTKLTLKTYDSGVGGQVWGGTRTYTGLETNQLLAAVADFTSNNKDPKAAIIPSFNFASTLAVLTIPVNFVVFFYDGPAPPPEVFAEFNKIKSLTDDTKVTDFAGVSQELMAGDQKALRFRLAVNSFPCMPKENMTAFLQDHYDTVRDVAIKTGILDPLDFRFLTFTPQPVSHIMAQASKDANGGNAIGLDPAHGDKIWVEYDLGWIDPLCDKACPAGVAEIVRKTHELHASKYAGIYPTNYQSGDLSTLRYVNQY